MSEAGQTVITQARGKVVYFVIGTLAFMAICEWLFAVHPESRRYSQDTLQLVGGLGSVACAAAAVFWIVQLALPARLVLTSEGLSHVSPFGQRKWAWSDIGPFEIEMERRRRVIRFTVRSGAGFGVGRIGASRDRETLYDLWRPNLVQVRDALNEARQRWSVRPPKAC